MKQTLSSNGSGATQKEGRGAANRLLRRVRAATDLEEMDATVEFYRHHAPTDAGGVCEQLDDMKRRVHELSRRTHKSPVLAKP